MASFVLKVKSKHGQSVLSILQRSSSIRMLKDELSKLTKIPVAQLHVLHGFPPRPLDLSLDGNTLEACHINSGDTLIIEMKELPPEVSKSTHAEADNELNEMLQHTSENLDVPGVLLKKTVPADNSCLFTSIGFTIGGRVDVTNGSYMREVIAAVLESDIEKYNEAFLGRPNAEYCAWIKKPTSWGGAIELAVLSQFYGIEIAVVDTINAIINRFGEDQSYGNRVFLIFDGVHYDPLYFEPAQGNGTIQTVFPTSDERMLREAQALAVEAQLCRQFTDMNKFTLECRQCGTFLTGQAEAQKHAKETGHVSFGEVSR
uniref:Ubiquitin thioesterase OTU n=1 Tax=Graphocephala atropunctata TaxID=36148 RepID=A0A1B6MJL6_9HEMI